MEEFRIFSHRLFIHAAFDQLRIYLNFLIDFINIRYYRLVHVKFTISVTRLVVKRVVNNNLVLVDRARVDPDSKYHVNLHLN